MQSRYSLDALARRRARERALQDRLADLQDLGARPPDAVDQRLLGCGRVIGMAIDPTSMSEAAEPSGA